MPTSDAHLLLFVQKVLLGVSAERVRWNQCVELVNKRLGMAVGALFIRDHFDPKSKEMVRAPLAQLACVSSFT